MALKRFAVTAAWLVSIYDVPGQPTKVLLEACEGPKCKYVVVKKSELESEVTIDRLVEIFSQNSPQQSR